MCRLVSTILLLLSLHVSAQVASPSAGESRMARALQAAAGNPLKLRALLMRMPKGGELHMHFSGAVYAETFIADARADLMCVDPATGSLAPNVGTTRSIPPQPVCGEGRVRADAAFSNQALYDQMINAFSMRSFVPRAGFSGHDQFFSTFDRFDPTHSAGARHGGEWLDEVASRAAAQNEQYLEIMHTPDLGGAIQLAGLVAWPGAAGKERTSHQDTSGTTDAELAAARQAMLTSPQFESALSADRAEFAKVLADRKAIEHCGESSAAPGCAVEVRFLFQVLRAMPPSVVFAQTLLAFEIAQRDLQYPGAEGPIIVGLNYVQPEDNRVAMAEYARQMRIVGFLHQLYPRVHIALHAGELVEGLVPPDGLRFHIRQAVQVAHAERIGHGVDVAGEDDSAALLKQMASQHIMMEINLTSNDVILGITGARHPLPLYLAAGVPVALSTDDEGVSRIDLTHEYVRAVLDFHLGYHDLKRMARTSLEHSFLPGASLWESPDDFSRPVPVCGPLAASNGPSSACGEFLRANRRAAQQWDLERRFHTFEAGTL